MWWQAHLPSTSTLRGRRQVQHDRSDASLGLCFVYSFLPNPPCLFPDHTTRHTGQSPSPLLPRQRSTGEPCQPRSQSVSVSRHRRRRRSPTPTSVGLFAQDSKTAPSLIVTRHNLPLSDLIYAILRTGKHRSDIQYDAGKSAADDQTVHIRQQARHPGGTQAAHIDRSNWLYLHVRCTVYPSQYLVSLPMLPDPRCTSRRHWTKPTRLLHCQFHQ